MRLSFAFLLLASLPYHISAQQPEWIWHDINGATPAAGETRFFRHTFNNPVEVAKAELVAAGDDEITVWLNGKEVARSSDWRIPARVDVTTKVHQGQNVLAVRGRNNQTGPAAILLKLEIRSPNMFGQFVLTDPTWLTSAALEDAWTTCEFNPAGWSRAVSLGKLGVAPWGDVLGPPQATPAESLTLLPGFKAELLRSALPEEGSWVCMTIDNNGRFIISPDPGALIRITLSAAGQVDKVEKIALPVGGAQGLLYAHDTLYVNGEGPDGPALYRLRDSDADDRFDTINTLIKFRNGGDHGPHAVVLGPDQMIYVMNGNFTPLPEGLSTQSPHRHYAEDLLLPRLWDANGHAKGILAPGGHVLRTDPEGRNWEILCAGFRNAYDLDFNPDGEMFTFDSDMEWDVGAPWYRPTRVVHCVAGGEYGWRSGAGKWPAYYADSLPMVMEAGLSSPTGVKFGTKAHFPQKYKDAFYIADWAYGRILATHLEPKGASYTGTVESFVSGKPLAVTDIEIGADGAMYFIIGGWNIQSGLYRVTYLDERQPKSAAAAKPDVGTVKARAIRRQLEKFHGKKDPGAIDFAWRYLDSDDRWLRYAARIAIEAQPLSNWQQRAFHEPRVDASIQALVALARCGTPDLIGGASYTSLQTLWLSRWRELVEQPLTERQWLDALRALQLCFIRMEAPNAEQAAKVTRYLETRYPANSYMLNRELCQLLVYLGAPDVVPQTMTLLAAAPTQEEQIFYAYVLRNANRGWTPALRQTYFAWFGTALRHFKGGASLAKYLENIRQEALARLSPDERQRIEPILRGDPLGESASMNQPRAFVKEWQLEELTSVLHEAGQGRSFRSGKDAFATLCQPCHRMGQDGGVVGPDLTGVSRRFGRRDLLENVFFPSKIISDRYTAVTLTRQNDEEINGCIVAEESDKLVVEVNPLAPHRIELLKADIKSREALKVSPMPEGLLNVLTKDEILDLLAFVEADGAEQAPAFGR